MPAITRAIVRPPGPTFAKGLTSASKGAPDVSLALAQHSAYRGALRHCGVDVIELPPSADFPDATFVEDVAIISDGHAILTRPGAPSRQYEVGLMRDQLRASFSRVDEIVAPGTVDGGDICDTPDACYIGISDRTNEAGATQLGRWLESIGRRPVNVDIRPVAGLLHLKSAIAFVGDTFVVAASMRDYPALKDKRVIYVDDDETYAANCVEINGRVFVAAGFPRLASTLQARGFDIVTLEMSEFEKMDGGLSCLSLRF
ncbi:MAG TPA: arginine deiminase-related protein [Candidatus Eremiobacteraceae bacterium]|nr:arginine deiminase-related protein [Candidatus Eremiobacteraceae bacterium]